jgi:hypothetical protein
MSRILSTKHQIYIASAFAGLTYSNIASAATFGQVCNEGQSVPVLLDTESGSYFRERGLNDFVHLQNNIDNIVDIRGNPRITSLDFVFWAFDTEYLYDFVRITDNHNGAHIIQPTGSISGYVGNVAFDNLQQYGGRFLFHTDWSVMSSRVNLTAVTTHCQSSGSNGVTSLVPGRRALGILNGTTDTVYMSYTAPYNSSEQVTIALWSDISGTDFDLYLRCDALPTGTSFTLSSTSGSSQEFIRLPPGTCPNGSTIYLAVNSWSGAGSFGIVASHSFVQSQLIVATTDFVATTAEIDQIANTMSLGMRTFYGMTEGGWWVPNIYVCNIGKCFDPRYTFAKSTTSCPPGQRSNTWGGPWSCPCQTGHVISA